VNKFILLTQTFTFIVTLTHFMWRLEIFFRLGLLNASYVKLTTVTR